LLFALPEAAAQCRQRFGQALSRNIVLVLIHVFPFLSQCRGRCKPTFFITLQYSIFWASRQVVFANSPEKTFSKKQDFFCLKIPYLPKKGILRKKRARRWWKCSGGFEKTKKNNKKISKNFQKTIAYSE
jgi:hypothetical protein